MISHLTIRGFRGIPHELQLDLGRITLLSGRNGLGKTTIFDALDWGLFGSAWRLGDEHGAIKNLYKPELEVYVSLTLNLQGKVITVERTEKGARLDGQPIPDKDLVLNFLRDPDLFPPYFRDPAIYLRRLTYLPQSEIRQLLSSHTENERIGLFHSLLGVPNANLLESSIRRVSDRISQRCRTLEDQLETVRQEMREFSLKATVPHQAADYLVAETIGRANQLLDNTGMPIEAPEVLLNLCRGQIDSLRNKKARVSEFHAFLVESLARRNTFTDEMQRINNSIPAVEQSLTSALEKHRRAIRELEKKQTQLQMTQQMLEQVTRRLEQTRRVDSLVQQIDETRRTISRQQQVSASAESTLSKAEHNLRDGETALGHTATTLQAYRQQLDRIIDRRNRAQRIRDLTNRHGDLEKRVDERHGALIDLSERVRQLETETNAAWRSNRDREKLYNAAVLESGMSDRLTSILAEVTNLVEQLDLAACPLCGANYQEKTELINHIRRTASGRSQELQRLAELRQQLDASRTFLTGKAQDLVDSRARLENLRGEAWRMSTDLQQLTTERQQLGNEEPEQSLVAEQNILEARIRHQEENTKLAEEKVSAARSLLGDAETQLSLAQAELRMANGRFESLLAQLPERSRQYSSDTTGRELAKTEQEYLDLATLRAKADEEEQNTAAAERLLADEVTRAKMKLSDLRAELAGYSDHTVSLDRDIQARANDIFHPVPPNLSEGVADELDRLARRESELTEACSQLNTLVNIRYQEDLTAQVTALRDTESNLLEDLEEINRARTRFDGIIKVARDRSLTEAQEAAKHLNSAIQECLTALYPHSHLDRVDFAPDSGSILLSDRLLQQAVVPDLYTSTGQLNVLALAVFIGVALRQRLAALNFLLLDEPVQNLDDVHFLAFITLIKRVALLRQVIFSTADSNIADLFSRQMKSTWATEKDHFVRYDWRGFDPTVGPHVIPVSESSSEKIGLASQS